VIGSNVQKDQTQDQPHEGIGQALGRIPGGLFILTARFEDRATGMLASWVQQASFQPPMISLAIGKGRSIMPLISNSHQFGLCQIAVGDKVLLRKFASGIDPDENPFLGFELEPNLVSKSPILANCLSFMECDLVCHMDYEGDHDIFIGKVINGGLHEGEPMVHLRDSGYNY
jgi:flavin reductase (DIM6/NTAB) family NADH-FMN oxidoreductase RutF